MLNRRRTRLSAKTILQWVFRRDQELVTCQLDIEPNASILKAMMRHAAFVDRLRSNGWTLIEYTQNAAA